MIEWISMLVIGKKGWIREGGGVLRGKEPQIVIERRKNICTLVCE